MNLFQYFKYKKNLKKISSTFVGRYKLRLYKLYERAGIKL